MAGGSGTRFWPFSRDTKPKQFLDVLGTGRTLLQMTFDRFKEMTILDKIWIVSNEKYGGLIREQLPEIGEQQILLEPEKRNTGPCIAYASYKILKNDPNAVLVVSPSDHVIFKEKEFEGVIDIAVKEASKEEKLITIGIQPNRPETGYGYIQFLNETKAEVKKVKTFTEKPAIELATKFLESGDFLWNSGIFVWSINSIIKAFETHDMETAALFSNGLQQYYSSEEEAFVAEAYSQCKNISIDYALMEKADNVFVVLGDFGWSDLGSWNALHKIREKDNRNNVIEATALTYDANDNYIKAPKGKVVVAQGVEGLLIADFEDVLLVCKKDDSSIFRQFIYDVKENFGGSFI